MAIQINSTSVIDNSRQLVNITGADSTSKSGMGIPPNITQPFARGAVWWGNKNRWLAWNTQYRALVSSGTTPYNYGSTPTSANNTVPRFVNSSTVADISSSIFMLPDETASSYKRTTDGGATWERRSAPRTMLGNMIYDSTNGVILWPGSSGYMGRSTNNGVSFTDFYTGEQFTSNQPQSIVYAGGGVTFYSFYYTGGTPTARLYKSTNAFSAALTSQTNLSGNIPTVFGVAPLFLQALTYTNGTLFAWARVDTSPAIDVLLKSTNDGASFSQVTSAGEFLESPTQMVAYGNTLAFVAGPILGVSKDLGATWSRYNIGGVNATSLSYIMGPLGGPNGEYLSLTNGNIASGVSTIVEI